MLRLARLVDDLFDMSRLGRGMVRLDRTMVSVQDVLASAVELTSARFADKRHAVTRTVAPDLRVDGDAERLVQVFANLLANAAKYTPPGGHVAVHAGRDRDDVVVRIEDDGIGIPPEILPHLFDPFVQGPQGAGRVPGGLGLGLSIVRSLVTMHGGVVEVRSDGPHKGSAFTVRLPRWTASAPVLASAPSVDTRSEAATAPTPQRVLLVDDNEDVVEMMSEFLTSLGYMVRRASSGRDALRVAEQFAADVAVLDIGLPDMDGYELAAKLRTLQPTCNARLVALTGYGEARDRAKSKRAGFEAHLVKPVDTRVLLAEIERAPAA
jgi:CheY-like chemotaxis protein